MRHPSYKYSSLSGFNISKKNNSEVFFESSLERDFIYLLEFDSTIRSYLEQPVKIKFLDGVSKRSYTPDFILEYHDSKRRPELVEIKYFTELEKKHQELEIKFDAAKSYCQRNEMLFRVISDKEIRNNPQYLSNVKFLSRYKHAFDHLTFNSKIHHTSFEDSWRIVDKVAEMNRCLVKDLINSVAKDTFAQAEALFYLWHFIGNKYILCDLNKELSMDTMVWIN